MENELRVTISASLKTHQGHIIPTGIP